MRVSKTSLGLICESLIREISASWKRAFLLISLLLFLYLFLVIQFVSSSLSSQVGLHWTWIYNRLLNAPENVHLTVENTTPTTTSLRKLSTGTRKRPNDTHHCEDVRRIGFPLGENVGSFSQEDSFTWQRVRGRAHETYVFSAYYDDRMNPARVVILGISDEYVQRESVSPGREFCQVWYRGGKEEDVVEAEFSYVPEHHDLRFAASLHICSLKRNNLVPFAVSLIVDRCRQSQNVVRVQDSRRHSASGSGDHHHHQLLVTPSVNYTICVSPLIHSYDNYQQLVESVEVNRIFGANEFLFYNLSTDRVLDPFLRSYTVEGIARSVIPWNIPPVEIHYFGQVVALNDCLYRSMFRSRFVVFTDLDELIVPRNHATWNDMLDAVLNKTSTRKEDGFHSPSTYIFRNTFFPKDWANKSRNVGLNPTVRQLGLRTLQLDVREDKIYQRFIRSKYMVRPEMIEMVGIHFPFKSLSVYSPTVHVDPSLGLVHHYRDEGVDREEGFVGSVVDRNIFRFQDLIVARTRDRYRRLVRRSSRTT